MHTHTPDGVYDDDIDRQSATCTGCGNDLQRVWLPAGSWSAWTINTRSQPLIAV